MHERIRLTLLRRGYVYSRSEGWKNVRACASVSVLMFVHEQEGRKRTVRTPTGLDDGKEAQFDFVSRPFFLFFSFFSIFHERRLGLSGHKIKVSRSRAELLIPGFCWEL